MGARVSRIAREVEPPGGDDRETDRDRDDAPVESGAVPGLAHRGLPLIRSTCGGSRPDCDAEHEVTEEPLRVATPDDEALALKLHYPGDGVHAGVCKRQRRDVTESHLGAILAAQSTLGPLDLGGVEVDRRDAGSSESREERLSSRAFTTADFEDVCAADVGSQPREQGCLVMPLKGSAYGVVEDGLLSPVHDHAFT